MTDQNDLDPDRHLKRLQKVFGVSKKIQELAVSKIKSDPTSDELIKEAESLAEAKNKRKQRIDSIDAQHRYVIDMVADQFNVSGDELIEGVADAYKNVQLLHSIVEKNGHRAIIFFYDSFNHPPKGMVSVNYYYRITVRKYNLFI